MNENTLGFIKWGAGITMTLAMISLLFLVFGQASSTTKVANSKINEMNSQIQESEILMYDETIVSGSDVISCIKKFKNDYVGVRVVTGKNSGGTWYGYNVSVSSGVATVGSVSSAKVADAIDETKSQYVNTGGQFVGKVYRDANGSIVALEFTQR